MRNERRFWVQWEDPERPNRWVTAAWLPKAHLALAALRPRRRKWPHHKWRIWDSQSQTIHYRYYPIQPYEKS
jgi:hypothetical protein